MMQLEGIEFYQSIKYVPNILPCWGTINLILKCLNQDEALGSKLIWVKGGCRNCLLLVCVREEELLSACMHAFYHQTN